MLNTEELKTYIFLRRKNIILLLIDFFIYFLSVFLINFGISNSNYLTNIFFRYFPIWLLLNYLSNRYHTFAYKNIIRNFVVESIKLLINSILFVTIIYFSINLNDNNLLTLIGSNFIFTLLFISFFQLILKITFFNIKKEKKFLIVSNHDKFLEISSEINSVSNIKIEYLGYDEIVNFDENLNKYKVLVIENLSLLSEEQMVKLFKFKEQGLPIMDVFQFYDTFFQRYPPIVSREEILINKSFENNRYLRFKRLGDLMFSILILLIFLPFGLIISFFILIEDGLPIFYKQVRTGHHGNEFEVFKFRTMKNNSEKEGPQWSSRNDKRITKFGKFLRLTRIDEIPQLLCVIKGQMSLIGPRPERPEMELILEKEINSYRLRHTIKPGLSGWAQINYPYGASVEDSNNKLSYDLYYINKVSFLLDLIIFFRTIKLVLNANNALPKK